MRFSVGLDTEKDDTFFDDTVGVFLGWFFYDDLRCEPDVHYRTLCGERPEGVLNFHKSFVVCRQANRRLFDTGVICEVS